MNRKRDPEVAERIRNAHGYRRVDDTLAQEIRMEYISDESTSYRKLAAKHGVTKSTIVRAIDRASKLVAGLLVVLFCCVDGFGCNGELFEESEPGFGWCCDTACGLSEDDANGYLEAGWSCSCDGTVSGSTRDTAGVCLERGVP